MNPDTDDGLWSIAAVFLLVIGISGLTAVGLGGCCPTCRDEYLPRPLKQCTATVDHMDACPGKRLRSGVIGCYRCIHGDKIFPGPNDFVLGCYDYARNHYCVDEAACDDMQCEASP